MKKIFALLLVVVMSLSLLVGCGGASKKQKEMQEVFDLFGNRYGQAVEYCTYHDVIKSEELAPKFSEWKDIAKTCGRTVAKGSLLTEEEMDAVIAQMQELIPEFEALIAQYPLPETEA